MKKLVALLAFIGVGLMTSCSRPAGPPGPPGPPGAPGTNIEAEVFEVTRSFGPNNGFSALIPLNPPIFASDVVLVYLLWEVDGGEPVWRLMPQTVQLEEGDLIYNFDFTRFDVSIFLQSLDFPLNILGPQWTQGQTFRIVLIPGFFGQARIDYSNYDAVMAMLGLTEEDVKQK